MQVIWPNYRMEIQYREQNLLFLPIMKPHSDCHTGSSKSPWIPFLVSTTSSTFIPLHTLYLRLGTPSTQRTLIFCHYFYSTTSNTGMNWEVFLIQRLSVLTTTNLAEIKLFPQKPQLLLEWGLAVIPCYTRWYNIEHTVPLDNCRTEYKSRLIFFTLTWSKQQLGV